MFDLIITTLGTIVLGGLAFWGAWWKNKATLRQVQLDKIKQESMQYQQEIQNRLNEVRQRNTTTAIIDTKNRNEFK